MSEKQLVQYARIFHKAYKYEDRYGAPTMTEENPRREIRELIESCDDSSREEVVKCLRQIYQIVMTRRQRERQDPVSRDRALGKAR